MPNIPVQSEAHWHDLRARNVGSSDQPALWGVSPFKTPFQLWHEKAGHIPPEDLSGNARVTFGRTLEAGIAVGIADLHGLTIRKARRYVAHEYVEGMGASLDYEIRTDDAGWVPFEIKNVDWMIFRDRWLKDDEGNYEPPEDIDIQVQHQISCTEKPYAYLGVLVGGNDPHLIRRDRHDRICAAIKAKVAQFWQSIRDGVEPDPDYGRDYEALAQVRLGGGEDMRGDALCERLIRQYAEGRRLANEGEDLAERAKAELLDRFPNAGKLVTNLGSVTLKTLAANPEETRTVTVKARPERRQVLVYPKKAVKEAA